MNPIKCEELISIIEATESLEHIAYMNAVTSLNI